MAELKYDKNGRLLFTKEMRKEYTILVPNMLPIHFGIMRHIFDIEGYHMALLNNSGERVKSLGLKYTHNDICYPALLVTGQFLDALTSGEYDPHKCACIIMQSGGGCRASNYIHIIRKALARAGFDYVPVISINLSGMESNPGFDLSLTIVRRMLAGVIYGDMLMLLSNQTRPYEIQKGQTDRIMEKWMERIGKQFRHKQGYSTKEMKKNLHNMVETFAKIPCDRSKKKVRVGIVGEIYVKFAAFANNYLEQFLAEQDCEVMVPGFLGFFMFKVDARIQDHNLYGGRPIAHFVATKFLKYLEGLEKTFMDAVAEFPQFTQLSAYQETKAPMKDIIGIGNRMGEGWFLPAEMVELVVHGYENIVCTQPFGCLPTHICGKGMIHKIKDLYPNSNIVPVDYDPGATKVNQENRIKLMLAVAREKLEREEQPV